jgi:uncharacterized protein (DUF983 family)
LVAFDSGKKIDALNKDGKEVSGRDIKQGICHRSQSVDQNMIPGKVENRTMKRLVTLLIRALALRCPICGEGKLFRRPFQMHEYCPCCHYKFEREEGYFSGAMALAIIISEFLITAIALPLAFTPSIPIVPSLLIGAPLVFLLPILFFHHSRSMWLALDLFWHPVSAQNEL